MPRMSLELVVVAIVILVVALVMLTIFGVGIRGSTDFTTARSQCAQEGAGSCRAVGQLPGTWGVATKNVVGANGQPSLQSCSAILNNCVGTCLACNFPTQ